MAKALTPFLMFEGDAEEAITLYVSALGATLDSLERFPADDGHSEGKISAGFITVAGQRLRFFDSPAQHGFTFTPSISFFLDCESAEEVDRVYGALSDGGAELMPVSSDYPFAQRFGWCNDRFGVSWQISFV